MSVIILTAPRVLLGTQLVADGWVQIDRGTIVAAGTGAAPAPPTVALPAGTLAPGLVDAQFNGAFGHDLGAADAGGWREIAERLPATGVTAYAPTFITDTIEALSDALVRAGTIRPGLVGIRGARTLGVHVEGPFLAAGRHGAHREDLLVDPTPERIDALLDASGSGLSYVTLAPERAGALEAIVRLRAAGIRVAVGHSDANDAQASDAADAGATLVTHLFNAQRPFAHRDPGVVGTALTDPRFTVGLIADLHHVAATAVRLAFAAAAGRVMLVTDAVSAMGMPPGTYILGGVELEVVDGGPPLRGDDTIAGSALRLDEAVANTIGCGIDPITALLAATRVPADALGRPDLGRIEPGCPADLVWLDDGWRATATWVDGRLCHAPADDADLLTSTDPMIDLGATDR